MSSHPTLMAPCSTWGTASIFAKVAASAALPSSPESKSGEARVCQKDVRPWAEPPHYFI